MGLWARREREIIFISHERKHADISPQVWREILRDPVPTGPEPEVFLRDAPNTRADVQEREKYGCI